MANLITTVEASGLHQWEAYVLVTNKSVPLEFVTKGCEFQDGSTSKTITPDASNMYRMQLQATAPANDRTVQHATVYYDDDGMLVLHQQASLNIVRPVVRTIDFKTQTQGFSVLPKGATATEDGLMVMLGEMTADAALDVEKMVPLKDLPAGPFVFESPLTVIYDGVLKRRYWLNDLQDKEQARIVKQDSISLADVIVRYNPVTYMREVMEFTTTGQVNTYGATITAPAVKQLGIVPVRVTYDSTPGQQRFYVIDQFGVLRSYDSNLVLLTTDSSRFYVNGDARFRATIDRDGVLRYGDLELSDQFYYQFGADSTLVYGYDRDNATTVRTYNLLTKELTKRTALTPENILLHRAEAAISHIGGMSNFGPETALVDGNRMYVGLTSNPYMDDVTIRRFGYITREASNLKHVQTPDYNSVLPAFNTQLGESVTATFKIVLSDADQALPITLPSGITWKATVNGVETKNVRNGQTVTVVAQGQDLTNTPFPISVGRSSGLIEVIPDSLPDAFEFVSVHDQPENFWYKTEAVRITGINVRVPVTATVNKQVDYSRLKFYVDGVLTPMPVYIKNNQTLQVEVYHALYQTRVDVTVGDYTTQFGVFTIDELPLPEMTNWCYVPANKPFLSDLIKNDSPADLDLEITSGNATFLQGGTKLKLASGMSTRLRYTPLPNTKGKVEFKTVVYEYEWHVWSHDHWLDAEPQTVTGEPMELKDSAAIKFDAIPQGFKTKLHVPAGILLEVGGETIEHEVDSRGLYASSFEQEIVVADLIVSGIPRTSPYVIPLGDTAIVWRCIFATDLSYEAKPLSVHKFVRKFLYAFRHSVTTAAIKAVQRTAQAVAALDMVLTTKLIDVQTVKQKFTQKLIRSNTFEMSVRQAMLDAHSFSNTFEQKVIRQVSTFKNKVNTLDLFSVHKLMIKDWVVIQNNVSEFGQQEFDYQTLVERRLVDMYGPDYISTSSWLTEFQLDAQYRTKRQEWSDMKGNNDPHMQEQRWVDRKNDWQYKTLNWYTEYFTLQPRLWDTEYNHYIGMTVNRVLPEIPIKHELVPRWTERTPMPTYTFWIGINVVLRPSWYEMDLEAKKVIQGGVFEAEFQQPWHWVQDVVHSVGNDAPYTYVPPTQHWIDRDMVIERLTVPTHYLEHKQEGVYVPGSTPSMDRTVSPRYIETYAVKPHLPMTPRPVDKNPIPIAGPRKRAASPVVTLPIKRNIRTDITVLDEGEKDPYKIGYFATEQLALEDAVVKWGHDPSAVRGVQRPDGAWYWIRIIPCDNSCGAYSCDARGYLAGG